MDINLLKDMARHWHMKHAGATDSTPLTDERIPAKRYGTQWLMKRASGADSTPLTHEHIPAEKIWHVTEF